MKSILCLNEKNKTHARVDNKCASVPLQTVDTISFADTWMLPLRKQKMFVAIFVWYIDMNPFSIQSKTLSMWSTVWPINAWMFMVHLYMLGGFYCSSWSALMAMLAQKCRKILWHVSVMSLKRWRTNQRQLSYAFEWKSPFH